MQLDLIQTQTRLPERGGGVMACPGGGREARAAICRARGCACMQVALEMCALLAAMQAVMGGAGAWGALGQ